MSTKVQLEIFEGPLDLLLHLIKKNEVSITDVPIATITEQYLSTLEVMQSLNLDVAGEFLVMAATLIQIKSRMLLPPGEGEGEGEGEEEEDTREELIRRMLEYQRFKDAAEELEKREILRRDVFVRPSEAPEEVESVGFEGLSLFDLISAFRHILERFPEGAVHEVTLERISVREKMNLLLDDLHRRGKVVFQSLFAGAASRMEVVVTFLAMLELVRIRAIRVWQEERVGPIVIELTVPLEEVHDRMAKEEIKGDGHGA
ncbi:MAG: segregation/condensation protein A [Deltaproteobacteria bacterium]|nr:segregation/condensation protein A [Deltaproteobacteria bacterium]